MLWFVFALGSAFFDTTKDVFSKKALKNIDEYVVVWSTTLFTPLFLLPFILISAVPHLGKDFLTVLFIMPFINAGYLLSYVKAIKSADLSATIPVKSLSPLLIVFVSPFLVHEFPKPLGLLGVIFIVMGSYVLSFSKRHIGYLEPFRAMVKEQGPRYMLLSTFLASIGFNLDKLGLINSGNSAVFWLGISDLATTLVMLPIILFVSKNTTKQITSNFGSMLIISVLSIATFLFQLWSLGLAIVPYVSSVKRTSILFSVLAGYFLFKEQNIKERLSGALIMLLGIVLIAFS